MSGIVVDVRTDIGELQRQLGVLQKDLPFMTAYALTHTAQDIRSEERKVMERVFDRPTRFTLDSQFVKTATKTDLRAEVRMKEGFGSIPAWRYLGPQVEGGRRAKKSHERMLERAGILRADEYVVPGSGYKLDGHGNMRGGDIVRILSQLGAAEKHAGYAANMSKKSRRRNVTRAGGRYMVLRGQRAAPDGIYQRKGSTEVVPIMVFVRALQYRAIYPFRQAALEVYDRRFVFHFLQAFDRYGPRRMAAAA